MKTKTLSKIIIGSSVLGILNGSYLTYLFVKLTYFSASAGQSFCDINKHISCSNVVTSKYAQLFGLPICVYAVAVYIAIMILAIISLKKSNAKNFFYVISILSGMGIIINSLYTYNEFYFIGAICTLCTICLLFITVNFVTSIVGYSKS